MTTNAPYRGRFAPSPTGPLHQGSLLAAVASFLDARAASGQWLLRIEDIDPPREVAGAARDIRRSLELHGLEWDEDPMYQSTRSDAYNEALEMLDRSGRLFRCRCTRTALGPGGSCGRRCQPSAQDLCSLRFDVGASDGFDDLFIGFQPGLAAGTDIVLKRKDGLFAYALAVAVDDAWQGITHVVRGQDLLHQTSAQRALIAALGAPIPRYAHHRLICDANGDKLSKQAFAPGIDDRLALDNLRATLRVLGQSSAQFPAGSPTELLAEAATMWDRTSLAQAAHSVETNGIVYPDAART